MPVAIPQAARLVLALALVVIACLVFRRPLERLARLGGKTLAALGGLAVLKLLGGGAGLALGVNLLNALVIALLGIPGLGLLMMLHWVAML